jgi:hypothetical protein
MFVRFDPIPPQSARGFETSLRVFDDPVEVALFDRLGSPGDRADGRFRCKVLR